MAPEQAKAERKLTPAVDVFSLGGVLAFAATARPPFGEGSGHDVFYRIVHQEPDLTGVHAVDSALAALVESCLAKDPAERPSAEELPGYAAANTQPGPVAWPRVTTDRISVRRAIAAAAPVAEFDGTELWSPPGSQSPPPTHRRNRTRPPKPRRSRSRPKPRRHQRYLRHPKPRPEFDQRASSASFSQTLALMLPLLLVLGGTAGTLFAIAPWTANTASGGDNGSKVVTTGTPTVSGAGISGKSTAPVATRAT